MAAESEHAVPPGAIVTGPVHLTGAVRPDVSLDSRVPSALAVLGLIAIVSMSFLQLEPDLAHRRLWMTSASGSAWLGVDLGATTAFSAVSVQVGAPAAGQHVIEASDDGVAWRELTRREGGFTRWRAAVGPTSARFVRVRLEDASKNSVSLSVYR